MHCCDSVVSCGVWEWNGTGRRIHSVGVWRTNISTKIRFDYFIGLVKGRECTVMKKCEVLFLDGERGEEMY